MEKCAIHVNEILDNVASVSPSLQNYKRRYKSSSNSHKKEDSDLIEPTFRSITQSTPTCSQPTEPPSHATLLHNSRNYNKIGQKLKKNFTNLVPDFQITSNLTYENFQHRAEVQQGQEILKKDKILERKNSSTTNSILGTLLGRSNSNKSNSPVKNETEILEGNLETHPEEGEATFLNKSETMSFDPNSPSSITGLTSGGGNEFAKLVKRTSLLKEQNLLPSELEDSDSKPSRLKRSQGLKRTKSVNNRTIVKYRQWLFAKRHTYITRSSMLNLLGMLITFLLAEAEISNGLSKFKASSASSNFNTTHSETISDSLCPSEIYLTTEYEPSFFLKFFNIFLTIITFFLIWETYLAYSIEVELYKYDNKIPADIHFVVAATYAYFGTEAIIYFFTPVLYVPFVTKVNYYTFPILYYIVLLRIPFLFRFIALKTVTFEKNIPLSAMMKLMEINRGTMVLESWRLVWRRFSSQIIVGSVVMLWLIAAWLCRLAEARFALLTCRLDDESIRYNIIDMLWLIPVTMTTIGYGDMTPQSGTGRVIALFVGFYGIVASAFLVGALHDILMTTRRERVIYNLMVKDQYKRQLENKAVILVQRCWRRFRQLKNKEQKYLNIESYRQENISRNVRVLKAMANFREVRLKKKYIETDNIDITDIGIKQSAIESDVGYVSSRLDKIEAEQKRFQNQMEMQLKMTNAKIDKLRRVLPG